MKEKIILASASNIRKEILEKHKINCEVCPPNVDESLVKNSLSKENVSPELISKNLAEIKSTKISTKKPNKIVLGADSVIDLDGQLVNKPKSREEAKNILMMLNGKTHFLITSVCISKNGHMIWNYSDRSSLKMKKLDSLMIDEYLKKISDNKLFSYGVYQIESRGKSLFEKIDGDANSIMGLPIKPILNYFKTLGLNK